MPADANEDRAVSVPNTEDLVIPADRQQLQTLAGVGAGFTVIGAAFVYYGTTKGGFDEVVLLVVGILAAGFFGLCTGVMLYRLLTQKGPALVLSADGLTDNSSAFPAGFVAWSEIEEVRANPRFVALQLRDESRVLARQSAWRRKLMRWNARRFGGHVFINASILPMQSEELLGLISERRSLAGA
jgi:hypothetical protein